MDFIKRLVVPKVLELHGSIVKIKCSVCDFKNEIQTEITKVPPLCKCGNILRPDVVWFGESLPQKSMAKSYNFC